MCIRYLIALKMADIEANLCLVILLANNSCEMSDIPLLESLLRTLNHLQTTKIVCTSADLEEKVSAQLPFIFSELDMHYDI